jgi:hypothetical protein
VGTVSTGAAIALVGQIFNIQEHWPGAVLLWAIAALAGWILLRDEAQQILTLLLFPAWMLCELGLAAEGHIGENVYLGRFLIVWAILYLTFFSARSARRSRAFSSPPRPLLCWWASSFCWRAGVPGAAQTYLPFGRASGAGRTLPRCRFSSRSSGCEEPDSGGCALAFPSRCPGASEFWTEHYDYGKGSTRLLTYAEPNLLAHALVAAFAVFIIWWGVRQVSRRW